VSWDHDAWVIKKPRSEPQGFGLDLAQDDFNLIEVWVLGKELQPRNNPVS